MYSPYLSGDEADNIINLTVRSVADVLNSINDYSLARRHSISASIHAAQLLRFGEHLGPLLPRRSLPVALASALLPHYFPHGNLLTFFAAICPGLCDAAVESGRETESLSRIAAIIMKEKGASSNDLSTYIDEKAKQLNVPSLASLAEGTADVSELVNALDANRSLFGFHDGPLSPYLEIIIRNSLNR